MTQATARHILVETEEQCLSLKKEIESADLTLQKPQKSILLVHLVEMVEI